MYKLLAVILICLGIFIGMNYGDEVQDIMDTDVAEQVQDKLEEGKDNLVDKFDEITDDIKEEVDL